MDARPQLTRLRVVVAAVAVADREGLAKVSMRSVGRQLGVEAMSLYHHVEGKNDLLDALADWIFSGIELPALDEPWREAMATRASSARAVLSAHPWALGLIESRRSAGPALLRHHDTVLGCLRTNGFTPRLAVRAFSAIDSYVYGFVLTEQNIPLDKGESAEQLVAEIGLFESDHPFLAEMVRTMVLGQDYSFADEFDQGLALILDGLADQLD